MMKISKTPPPPLKSEYHVSKCPFLRKQAEIVENDGQKAVN